METIAHTALGLKLAIENARSNLSSAKAQASWGIEGAVERVLLWEAKLKELGQ